MSNGTQNDRPFWQRRKWRVWFSGIGNGVIHGGATSVCVALGIGAANVFGAGIPQLTIKQFGMILFWGSISGGAAYLRESPWPRPEDATDFIPKPNP